MYGRQVASWLRTELKVLGYPVEEVIPEDWGWCVMCHRHPYRLWVGCVNLRDYEYAKEGDPPPAKDMLLWNIVPMAEVPFFRYAFRAKPDVAPGLLKLDRELKNLLTTDPTVKVLPASAADNWFKHNGA